MKFEFQKLSNLVNLCQAVSFRGFQHSAENGNLTWLAQLLITTRWIRCLDWSSASIDGLVLQGDVFTRRHCPKQKRASWSPILGIWSSWPTGRWSAFIPKDPVLILATTTRSRFGMLVVRWVVLFCSWNWFVSIESDFAQLPWIIRPRAFSNPSTRPNLQPTGIAVTSSNRKCSGRQLAISYRGPASKRQSHS